MLEFRPAEPNDLSILKAWDEKEHVLASDPNDDWNWEEELQRKPPWREFWMVLFSEKPIGFLQIIDPAEEDSHYWGSMEAHFRAIDIWIGEEAFLNKGFGTRMMRFALDRCFSNQDVLSVLVDPLESNLGAIRFYERLGFQAREKRKFGSDDCLVMELKKIAWDSRKGILD